MTADIIQYASVAGELAPNLWGRTDFAKYDSGWAQAGNWIVDYRGGLYTRQGFEFGDLIEWSEGEDIKLVEFQFSPDTANTYVCIFTDDKVRFVQDNAYVLEADVSVTSVAAGGSDVLTFTAAGHGFLDGEWIKLSGFTGDLLYLNNRTAQVQNKTANTFELLNIVRGVTMAKAGISSGTGTANRIYTVTSPYGQEDLRRLKTVQIRDYVRMMHPDYPAKNLIRNGATNWAISDEVIETGVDAPTNLTLDYESHSELRTYIYQVTAINEDGEESVPDVLIITDGPGIIENTGRRTVLSWTAVTGAVYYKIYRSRSHQNTNSGSDHTFSDLLCGYIGQSTGTQFTDPGITPDFADTPPVEKNPFADGRIRYATVSAAGTGYNYDSVITWPSGGSGAYGYLVTRAGGSSPVYGVQLWNGGKDYTGTTITAADGSSATITATLSEASGNNPHCGTIFQQRMVYAATDNDPLRIFGSRAGLLSNFNVSTLGADDDAYEFDLDAEKIAPIRHTMSVRGGLMVFTQINVWLVFGRQNNVLSPSNAQADRQNSVGASQTQPVFVDSNIIYATDEGQELRVLSYDDNIKAHESQNVSLLSNHLFHPSRTIKSLSYAATPHKIAYTTQSNGIMIATTLDAQNGVWACTPLNTKGDFSHCIAIEEENRSRLYVATIRQFSGSQKMFLERQKDRDYDSIEDAFCVDAGLELSRTKPDNKLTPAAFTGNSVTFTLVDTGPFTFSAGDIGKVLRFGTGKAVITGVTVPQIITCDYVRDLEQHEPEDADTPLTFKSGEWTMDETTTTLNGFWHLENKEITLLADGVKVTKTASDEGVVTLTTAASRVAGGYNYTCVAKTLPPIAGDTVIEGRRKQNVGLAIRMFETAGLKIGPALNKLRAVADRTKKLGHRPLDELRHEMVYEDIRSDWDRDAQLYIVQEEPLPATILNHIQDLDLGDDKD